MNCVAPRQGRLIQTSKISIYPNPFSDQLTIQWEGVSTQADLAIRNMLGQVVYQTQLLLQAKQSLSIPSGLPAGMYLLEVRGANIREVKQLLK